MDREIEDEEISYVTLNRLDWARYHSIAEFMFSQQRNYNEVYDELRKVYGDIAPEKDTIRKWQRKFEEGFPLVSILDPSGRPKVSELKNTLEQILATNPYISLTRIAIELEI
ncbi:MAG: hypothetical protein EZS28_049680, partial [Streblomastix strix]